MIFSKFKKIAFILICTLMSFNVMASSFIEKADTISPDNIPQMANPELDDEFNIELDEVYTVVEKMPALKGCENLEDKKEREKCTTAKLEKYLYANLKYPVVAKERQTEGTVIINCKVDKTGRMFDGRILKDIGDGCGKEALRVVNQMSKNGLVWTSGVHRDEKVIVEMNIPVQFKLEGKNFEVIEIMPTINDCKNFKTNKDKEGCTSRILLEYIYENIKYPNAAIDNGTEGKVTVQWIVSKTGEIIDVKSLSKVGDGCEEEAVRLISEMDKNGLKWNAGTQNGKNVNVQYRIPVRFTITKSLKKERKKELKRLNKN